jgi:hypothetical protein
MVNTKKLSTTSRKALANPAEEVVDAALLGGAAEAGLEPFGALAGALIAGLDTGINVIQGEAKHKKPASPTKKK